MKLQFCKNQSIVFIVDVPRLTPQIQLHKLRQINVYLATVGTALTYLTRPFLHPFLSRHLCIWDHRIFSDFHQTLDHYLFNLDEPFLNHSLWNKQGYI